MAIHALELGNLHHRPAQAGGYGATAAAARPPVARWLAYVLVVAGGIALFLGLDHLRSSAGRALLPASPAEAAPLAVPVGLAVVERPVAPGDTLWSIAVELRPDRDPRPLVDELARLNGGPAIKAGGSVLVPVELARPRLP
ncbi:MAG: hypothetical protein GEV08_10755 [Acidimicrobiia bacterium]|nr:hypothetical protein [Acidimicrobiia bacterium]